MAVVFTDNQYYQDIADAIRSKNGSSDTYLPSEMAAAIEDISGGGSTGGGGGGTLILTQALGTLTSSSSTERDTRISITVPGSEVNKYDVLFVATSVDDIKLGFHICTLRTILLQGSSNRNQKNNFSLILNLLNYRASSDGTEITYQGTTVYGVFPVSPSLDSTTQDLTFGMHYRYSASQSGKINGTYTTRVYGVKLTELMGV